MHAAISAAAEPPLQAAAEPTAVAPSEVATPAGAAVPAERAAPVPARPAPLVERIAPPPRQHPGPAVAQVQDQVKNAHQQARPPLDPNLRTLREVTTPLHLEEPQFPVDTEQVKTWISRLERERLLVLGSASARVVGAALHAIVEDDFFRCGTRKLTLALDGAEQVAHGSFELCLLPDHSEDTSNDGRDSTLVVVEATSDGAWSTPFMDDLFRSPLTNLPARKAKLQLLRRHVLVLMSGGLLSERERGWGLREGGLPCYHLPFHRPLIELQFARDPALCARLIAIYEARRDAGWFGASEQHQHDELCRRLRTGTLQGLLGENLESQPAPAVAFGADRLLDMALFVACFLSQLSPTEFQEVLLELLGDEPDPTWRPSFENEPPRLLKQRWRERGQRLLAAAGLNIGPDPDDGTMRLLFSTSSVDELKRAFRREHFFFCKEIEASVESSRWLYDPRPTVADAFMTLLAENATLDPRGHDEAWLCALILEAISTQDPGVLAQRVQRCALLLRKLLGCGATGTVEKSFVWLCETGRHDLVLGLTALLANARGFEQLHWIKRGLDQGDRDVAERAYALLLRLSLRDDSSAVETSSEWLQTRPGAGLSPSHLALLRLCVELGELTLWLPEQIGLGEQAGARLLCLTNPRSVGIVLAQSLTSNVDALLAQQDRWCFELSRVIDLWLVPTRVSLLLGDARASALKNHLVQVWVITTSDDDAARDLPPHRGMFQAILLAGAALTASADTRDELAAEVRQVLGQPGQRLLRAAVDRRIRAIEQCFAEVVEALDDAPLLEDRVSRDLCRSLRKKLRAQRATLAAFRTAQRQPLQPRIAEHAQPD